MPEQVNTAPSRTKVIAIGVAVVAVIAIIAVLVMGGDDDAEQPGISNAAGVDASGASTADPPVPSATAPLVDATITRTLMAPGAFTCAAPGLWQPYADAQLVLEVGEPVAGEVCPDEVFELPIGYCSAAPCTAVPDDWEIRLHADVAPVEVLAVVTPVDAVTALFTCFYGFVKDQTLSNSRVVGIEQSCPLEQTDTSLDIPYVPPATSDIPFVPPPASGDIPAG